MMDKKTKIQLKDIHQATYPYQVDLQFRGRSYDYSGDCRLDGIIRRKGRKIGTWRLRHENSGYYSATAPRKPGIHADMAFDVATIDARCAVIRHYVEETVNRKYWALVDEWVERSGALAGETRMGYLQVDEHAWQLKLTKEDWSGRRKTARWWVSINTWRPDDKRTSDLEQLAEAERFHDPYDIFMRIYRMDRWRTKWWNRYHTMKGYLHSAMLWEICQRQPKSAVVSISVGGMTYIWSRTDTQTYDPDFSRYGWKLLTEERDVPTWTFPEAP